jgi:site-specific recombinase XerD
MRPIEEGCSLARKLDSHRLTLGNPEKGLVFQSTAQTRLNLNNLANRVIRPTLVKAGLQWQGWHAFRRGLATNLNRLGIADRTVQAILRHADLSTTRNSYAKTISANTVAAMHSLERLCAENAPNQTVD